uniref:3-oxoacyl-[acyl-carrier-protein] reductase n=1 Tax=Parastrongyloides trichosuri TaxID=131310 RepID=A0A0N4Z823_PARTI
HHRGDRRHRFPDQPAGAQRRHRGGAGGGCRARLCRGGRRSAGAGPALGRSGQGDQDPDHRLGPSGGAGRQPGRPDRPGPGPHRRRGGGNRRADVGNLGIGSGTGDGPATGQYRREPDGSGHAAERRNGRGIDRRQPFPGSGSRRPGRLGGAFQGRSGRQRGRGPGARFGPSVARPVAVQGEAGAGRGGRCAGPHAPAGGRDAARRSGRQSADAGVRFDGHRGHQRCLPRGPLGQGRGRGLRSGGSGPFRPRLRDLDGRAALGPEAVRRSDGEDPAARLRRAG